MSAKTNHLNDSEEEELGALIYKSSQTAKKLLGLGSSASASASSGASNTKKRAGSPADDCPARNEGCKLIHERSFRYSLRSSSKKLKVKETTDGSSKCTGNNIPQQKQSQASEFKWASSELGSDNEDDSSDNEYPAEPSSYIASYTAGRRYNLRRGSRRQASNEATEPEPELISSTASTTPPSLSSTYCAVINEDGKSAEEMEGTYTDRKGREFVIERFAGKRYKHYCKPEDVNKKNSRAILMCKHQGCTSASRRGGVCIKHGAKREPCKVEGCANQQVTNHLCYSHGAPRKICKHNGCTNIVKGRGVCARHGYKQQAIICKHEGCQLHARKGGICFKHSPSGYPKCKVEGCHKNSQAGGTCCGHALKHKLCKNEGCTNKARKRGLCKRHQATIVSMTAAV